MAWYEDQKFEMYFTFAGKVQITSDESDWVSATVSKIGPSGLVPKLTLEGQAREYFKEFRAKKTKHNFAKWFKTKYGGGTPKRKAPMLAAKPKKLKPTAPPVVATQKFPTFSKFAVKSEVEVGHEDVKKARIRLHYHLLPNAHAAPKELEAAVTKRTLKWVRRVYAQANLAPKILGIDRITEVSDNTLSVVGVKVPGYHRPKLPSGQTTTASQSKITLTLTDASSDTESVEVPLTKDASTADIADGIKEALVLKKYAVTGPTTHLSDDGHYTSHDLVITKASKPVKIKASHDDAQFGQLESKQVSTAVSQEVLEVPTLAKGMDDEDGLYGGTPRQRQVLRLGKASDDQLDIYVLEKGAINGRAYPMYQEIIGIKSPVAPYRNAAYVTFWSTGREARGIVFDDQLDVSPFTLCHEIGHVLADTGHTEAEGCLMHGGWAKDNSVRANKRIYGAPLLVGSMHLKDEVPRERQDLSAELRARGNKKLLEPW